MDIHAPVPDSLTTLNTPTTISPVIESQKHNKSIKIFSILLAEILCALFFLPIPYYQTEELICKADQTNCQKPGWHLNPPLLQSIIASRATISSSVIKQPTPTPSLATDANIYSDWKTYTNTSFRYSIKYPNTWKANSISPGVGTMPLDDTQKGLYLSPPLSIPAKGMGIPIEDIHIQIEADSTESSEKTYEEWMNSTKKNLEGAIISISETELAATKAIVIRTGIKTIYLLSSPDKTKFFFIETKESNSKYRDIFNQILSTFIFLDKADMGTLEATVMRNPTCPGAQKPGEICEAPAVNETFDIFKVENTTKVEGKTKYEIRYGTEGLVKKQRVRTNSTGQFTLTLEEGSYQIRNTITGIGKDINDRDFTIAAGQTTTKRFTIDTGIR